MIDKSTYVAVYEPGSRNACGKMLQYVLSNAELHTAIAGGITYGIDVLANNSSFNWKGYGLNIATSMAFAGLTYQKPVTQSQNNMLADLRAAGIQFPGSGYGMSFDNPPGWVQTGDLMFNIPGTEIISTAAGQGGVDGMDIANYIVSNSGTLVGGAQYGMHSLTNSQQWKYSYTASKYLKGKGINVQTRIIKHGANGVLKNASRNITYIGLALSVADVAIDGELRASHLLNAGMVGVSAIPFAGWIIGGSYFVADMITLGVTGQSIGQHLDNYVGNPLVDDIYNW